MILIGQRGGWSQTGWTADNDNIDMDDGKYKDDMEWEILRKTTW